MDASEPLFRWQPSLFDAGTPGFDRCFAHLERRWLDDTAWIDVAPKWVTGANALFAQIIAARKWGQRTRWMYDKYVLEPRLTSSWRLASGDRLEPALLENLRNALSERYGVTFDSIGFNFYRDGNDSVAWHRDRIPMEIEQPIVALVVLGEPRRFLLRPAGGGKSIPYQLGDGDLLVTGGMTQRTWHHSVPKVAHAGPRLSLAFRHGMYLDD
jgi:alkylated DNA repair dioxygenase AlkB